MKEMVRYGFVLGLICFIASGLLAGMNSLTKVKILAQAQEQQEETMREVFPEAKYSEPVKSGSEVIYYKIYNRENKLMGVAFKASAKGYSSTIETMVAMNMDGTVNAIKVLTQNETPGLGTRVAEPVFTRQFAGKGISGLSEVQAITGATISSRAVIESVKKKAEEIQGLVKDAR